MKYVSIDIETTGRNPQKHQMIEFGAVVEDMVSPMSSLPTFHRYIVHYEYVCEPGAVSMNKEIFDILAQYDHKKPMNEQKYPFVDVNYFFSEFIFWLYQHGVVSNTDNPESFTVAGKNFIGFDYQFMRKILYGSKFRVKYRSLDPAILYWNPGSDEELPDLQECVNRAGFSDTVTHTAVEDAMLVLKLIRAKICLPTS